MSCSTFACFSISSLLPEGPNSPGETSISHLMGWYGTRRSAKIRS